jgi:hypothetical protein
MAGIYDKITRDTPSHERLAGNLLHAAYVLRAAGKFNDAQILTALNSYLTGRGGTALAGDQLTDLNSLASIMDSKPSALDKLVYAEVIRASFVTVEMGLMSENAFNTAVELSA